MKRNIKIIVAFLLCIGFGYIGWSMYKFISINRLSATNRLSTAIENNSIEEAEKWVSLGADVNAIVGACVPKTLLIKAIEKGNPEMVALLLSNGARVVKPKAWMIDPLDESISIALGNSLIISSVPPRTVRENQKMIIPLLMNANAPTQHPKIIPALLSSNLELVKAESTQNIPDEELMRAAIFSGNPAMIDYVLNYIITDKAFIKDDMFINLAIESGNEKIIDYVHALKAQRLTPLDITNNLKQKNTAQLLRTYGVKAK